MNENTEVLAIATIRAREAYLVQHAKVHTPDGTYHARYVKKAQRLYEDWRGLEQQFLNALYKMSDRYKF